MDLIHLVEPLRVEIDATHRSVIIVGGRRADVRQGDVVVGVEVELQLAMPLYRRWLPPRLRVVLPPTSLVSRASWRTVAQTVAAR